MADYRKAVAFVLENEGGYCNNASDPGGETYRGIARNFNPAWEGWKLVDSHKPFPENCTLRQISAILHTDANLEDLVDQFYVAVYWRYESLEDQRVATKLMDLAVNMQHDGSHGPAIKILQKAVCDQFPNVIECDAFWGQKTANAANQCNQDELLKSMAKYAADRYATLCEKNPNLEVFRKGWLARAATLPA